MKYLLDNLIKKDNFNLIETHKYKELYLSLRFTLPYDEAKKANLTVLSAILGESSFNYPSKKEMTKAKDLLYGIEVYCYPKVICDLISFTINFNFINARYLKDISENDYLNFIDEIIFKTNITKQLVEEAIDELKDAIKRELDVPSSKAYENFLANLAKQDKQFSYMLNDNSKELDKVSVDSVKETYNSLLKEKLDVYLIGDYTESFVKHFDLLRQNNNLNSTINTCCLNKTSEVVDELEVEQSSLIMAYKSPYTINHPEFEAFNLTSIMFGGIPSSLLFKEIRENSSLCYSINTQRLGYDGTLVVNTQIDAKNKDEVLSKVRQQLQNIQSGIFDDELLQCAKIMLINSANSMNDDQDYLIDYLYRSQINQTYKSIDELINKINKVNKEDIKRIANNFSEVFVYLLKGIKHD